jgi:ribosomal-protein-alanine N-acetyltransferase
MQNWIDTDRLRLRPFAADDLRCAFHWFGDPDVMRYTLDGPDRSMEQTAERIASYQRHESEYGFSRWLVIERASGQPIGDAGLRFMEQYGWVDFGYRLDQSHWGKGLATEAGIAWIQRAFGDLKLDRLVGVVHPANCASTKILRKLGFLEERRDVIMGMSCIVFSLTSEIVRNRTIDLSQSRTIYPL